MHRPSKFALVMASWAFFLLGSYVEAEKHIIRFDNRCGFGEPRLIQSGNVLSRGEDYVSDGPFWAGIAYLQTGDCLLNGEGCTLVEMSLANPTCAGCGSSADISLIPPLEYSVPATFSYFGGCDGQGDTCSSKDCKTAFFVSDDNEVQVQCQEDDVNLLITFCGNGSSSSSVTSSRSSTSRLTSTKAAATQTLSATLTYSNPGHTSTAPPTSGTSSSAVAGALLGGASSNAPKCSTKRSERRALASRERSLRLHRALGHRHARDQHRSN